jgi:hypothetical protein
MIQQPIEQIHPIASIRYHPSRGRDAFRIGENAVIARPLSATTSVVAYALAHTRQDAYAVYVHPLLNAPDCCAPRSIPAEGDLAVHRRALVTTICALVLVAAGGAANSLAQEEATTQRPADIRLGTCASLGDVVMPLASLAVPSGEALGQDGATPAEQSVTTLPLLLDDILATGHALAVHASPEQVGTPVACGEIGGALGEDGSLAIGLNAMNGAKISGAAYFAPTPEGDGTTVTLLLIDERAGRRGDSGVGGTSEPVAAEPTTSDPATVNDTSTVDDASGVDNATVSPAAAPSTAPAPAPATAGLDGVSTISASNEDGKNAKPDRNKDKATADRDANGNAGNATTDSATDDASKDKERDGERESREGGARAGEDGAGANG